MADIIPTVLDGIQHIETCWAMPPSLPYAVYHDRTTRRGADLYNGISEHNITIELYAQKPAEDLEPLILVGEVELLQSLELRREAALAGRIDDQQDLALVVSQ